jgi:hypothetical protein
MLIMKELVFLTKWGNDKERAWSGINWSLYNALSKYFDIDDINLSLAKKSIVDRIINKCTSPDIAFRETKRNGKFAFQKLQPGSYEIYTVTEDVDEMPSLLFQTITVGEAGHIYELEEPFYVRINL